MRESIKAVYAGIIKFHNKRIFMHISPFFQYVLTEKHIIVHIYREKPLYLPGVEPRTTGLPR